jgi:hypothetical protein
MVISSNVLTNIIAGVQQKKGTEGENSQLLPTIPFEVICTMVATVWTHLHFFLSDWPLVGTCNCASEGNVTMKACIEFWMASRSNNG